MNRQWGEWTLKGPVSSNTDMVLKELNYNKLEHGASVWWLEGKLRDSDNSPAQAT